MKQRFTTRVVRMARGLAIGAIVASASMAAPSLAVVGAAGCGNSKTPSDSPSMPAYAQSVLPTVKKILDETLTPGAVVLVRSPELGDFRQAFGVRSAGGTEPVTLADHVRIGSNTKTMTGTVILQLIEEGQLALDDKVSKFRSDVPNGDKITIELLLNMRSGIPTYSSTLTLNEALDATPQRVWTPEELVKLALQPATPPKPAPEPGSTYEYSNTNFVILGMIIEQLTKMPVEEAFKTRLFAKPGLTGTIMPALASSAIPDPHPRGYMFGTNVQTITSQTLPPDVQAAAKAGTFKPSDRTDDNPSWAWTAGSAISTADEMGRYVEAMVGGDLLGADLRQRRLASVTPIDPTNPNSPQYGWALAKLGPMFGHTGELPGFNTFMAHDPARKITIVVWSNLAASPDGTAPAVAIARAFIQEIYASGAAVAAPSGG